MKQPTDVEIKCSDIILWGENELQDSSSYSDLTCQDADIFQTSSLCYWMLPASGAQTPPDATTQTSSNAHSSSPSTYPNILHFNGLKRLPAPLTCTDMQPPLGGDSEPCVPLWDSRAARSPVSQLLHHPPIPVSFSGSSGIVRSAPVLSGPTEVASTLKLFHHRVNNSVPSAQPDSLSRPDTPSGTTLSPHSVPVDLTYLSL